jgi:predicted TIM-barrel fold metal-dependent hydrolase
VIDAHHHLGPEPDYADRLRDEAERLGFTRVVLVGLPAWKWPWATNDHVAQALRRHPHFYTGFAYVEPADEPGDGTDTVDRLRDAGFAGLKLIRTRRPYDDPSYLPTYIRAGELGMPVLFHTGMVSRTASDKERDVHSIRLRPAGIDYIARQAPHAQLIMAHLGHPWWDEAGEACRLNDNVYTDLSGPALRVLSPAELKRVLWWDAADDAGHHLVGTPEAGGAWRHVVFGSDVPYGKMAEVLGRYHAAMATLEVPPDVQAAVLGGTARRLLGI